jgi:threonine synthase
MPQNRISIATSSALGSRRAIVVEASGDVGLAAAYALALDMN